MNANKNKATALLLACDVSIELRKRVERLEKVRADACLSYDYESVELIDKMIKDLVKEWSGSLVVERDTEQLKKTA